MAGEIRLQAATGLTVKSLIVDEAGQVWNGSALVDLSTLADAAAWVAVLIACTEKRLVDTTKTGLYLADWPGALSQLAVYSVIFFSSPTAPTDLHIGIQQDPTEYAVEGVVNVHNESVNITSESDP